MDRELKKNNYSQTVLQGRISNQGLRPEVSKQCFEMGSFY